VGKRLFQLRQSAVAAEANYSSISKSPLRLR
jgi:hypothetical protein